MSRILKLEKMEIIGFKSFYGRTRFEFPDGITAVVGPNGCGKSNIGDAISWVLGEQRASALRSDRMEDVIFNGSESRRPLGMAEVSLHFRNLIPGAGNGHGNGGEGAALVEPAAIETALPAGDAVVAIPQATEAPGPEPPEAAGEEAPRFFALEEVPESVVVTRRLYRSGESEYILNGERCRLKDIQDLLSKTDVGSRLYSTIEQGKIDQVLVAKPRDRRALFEEAAGILGYKTRRRQAEARLDATRANLLRIADIASEVEKQINVLKRQAAKARRHQRLGDALRERRLALARARLLGIEADDHATREALAAIGTEEAAAAAALARDEAELEGLRLRLEEGEAAALRRREEIHGLDLELDRLAGRLRAGADQVRDLQTRLEETGRELESLAARTAERETRRAGIHAAIAGEAAGLEESAARLRDSDAGLEREAGAIAALELEQEATRTALLAAIEEDAAAGREAAASEEQTRALQASLERLRRESAAGAETLAAIRRTLAGLDEEEAEGARRLDEMHAARERLAADQTQAAARLAEAERRAEELRGRETALRDRVRSLETLLENHTGSPEGVQSLLSAATGSETLVLVGERLEVPRGLERAVEAALGERLQAVVVGSLADALWGIEHLRGQGEGRAGLVPASDPLPPRPPIPEAAAGAAGVTGRLGDLVADPAAPVVRAVLDRTLLVETLERAAVLRTACPGWAFVTPQGDLIDTDGMVIGGDGRVLDHGLLARRAELLEAARQAAEAARQREEAGTLLPELRGGLEEARAALAAAGRDLQDAERAGFERQVRVQQQQAEAARLEHAAPVEEAEQERLRRALAGLAARREVLGVARAAAAAARREREESIRGRGEGLSARRASLETARARVAESRAEAAARQEKLLALRRESDALAADLLEMEQAAGRRLDDAVAWNGRIAALSEEARGLETEAALLRTRRAEAAARDEAAHAGLAYDRGLLHARDQSIKERRQAHAALRDRAQEQALHRARLEAHLDALRRTCQDELQTSFEALRALPAPAEVTPVETLEGEIEALRVELEGLGPVNLMAIEQHGELEERFGFLTAQKTDLEQSIASLQESIRKINRQSRERFQAAFTAIQEYFQETFATLFGGGRAELRLQDDEDVLEAGIEIVAQPPGKRLQKIALLSGGEKALTAASLLFALFRYRPSPFCVLDEVDAPLDEANVERFTKLLQALREETQFILITHNRKSMEAADLLYGVTMEEPGVSKVLPLRFE